MVDPRPVRSRFQFHALCLLSAGIVLGVFASFAVTSTSIVRAEVTEEPRREAFKAGAVLNEPVLREIAATLKRIETQIERIDKRTAPTAALKK